MSTVLFLLRRFLFGQVNRKKLISLIQDQFLTKTRNEWIQLLSKSGLPYRPVNSIDQVFSDEAIKSKTTFTNDGIIYLKNAVTFQSTSDQSFMRSDLKSPPKSIGQNTCQVLKNLLHMSQEEINNLSANGIIRCNSQSE